MSFTIHNHNNNHANDNIDNYNHNNTIDNNTVDNHLDNNEIYNNNNNNNIYNNNNTQKKNITKPEIEPLSFTTCLCYGLIIFSTQILTLIFNTYYVEIYLNIHKLQPFYFYLGQFLYAIFNAINDPIFGFLSDYCIHYLQWKRSTLMLVSGPVLFLAFLGTVFSVTFEKCFAVLNSLLVIKYSFYTLLNNIFKTRIFFSLFILFLILLNNFQFELTFIPFIFLFFILIIIGSVGRLLEISLANIVDEDMFIYFRKFKNSGNIFGINALLTKPASSIAPSIGTFILNLNENYLFYLFVFTNLITATLQYLLWKYFDLHGTKLDYIQSELQKRQSSDNDDSEEEELDEDLRKEDENDHAPLLHH
ncbi:hypothetical protein ABK040_013632 [Willaertia magna]